MVLMMMDRVFEERDNKVGLYKAIERIVEIIVSSNMSDVYSIVEVFKAKMYEKRIPKGMVTLQLHKTSILSKLGNF